MYQSNLTIPPRIPAESLPYHLSPIESVRVVACLDEAVEKLAFLNTLTPDILAHRDELAALVGDEITTLIQEQKALEKEFELEVTKQHEMKSTSNPSEIKEVNERIKKISKDLQEKTSILCRNLRDSPNISENIRKIQTERVAIQSLLQRTTRDLTEFSYITLGKSVQEDKEKEMKLSKAEDNEKKAVEEIKKLKAKLANDRKKNKEFEDEIQAQMNELREKIKKLRSERFEVQSNQPITEAKLEAKKRVYEEEEEEWEKKNLVLQQKFVIYL